MNGEKKIFQIEIIKLFPCINPFIEDKEIYNFHYINSSVGLEGIVITKK